MSEQQAKQQTTLGEPMYVESLMTHNEWRKRMSDFPGTSHIRYEYAHRIKPNSFNWRFGMGKSLSSEEIENIIGNLDYLLKMIKS